MLEHEANSHAESYVYFPAGIQIWLKVTKAFSVSAMNDHGLT